MKTSPLKKLLRKAKNATQKNHTERASSITLESAKALSEHISPSALVPWIDFEDGFVVRDNGSQPQIGFGFSFSPALIAGDEFESQIESIISRAPEETTIQFACHSSGNIGDRIKIWSDRKQKYNTHSMLSQLVKFRAKHMMNCATDRSLLPNQRFHPREVRFYMFCMTAFQGDYGVPKEVSLFMKKMREFRGGTEGKLTAMGINPNQLNYYATRRLIRQLCNPQIPSEELDQLAPEITKDEDGEITNVGDLKSSAFEKRTRVIPEGSAIKFCDAQRESYAVPVSVDDYPETLRLFMTGELIGELAVSDCIPNEFWLTTIIHKPNQMTAKDNAQKAMALISKQCMSESEWYKSMMPHLFKRRNDTAILLEQCRKQYSMVRMMTAAIIWTDEEGVISDPDTVTGIWNKAGFKASPEENIALPVWQALLPWGYNSNIDRPNQGIQRSFLVSSMNAATAAICQGDWGGNGPVMRRSARDGSMYPYASGLLLQARRGQLGCVDIFDSPTNYNFSIVATSGAGKSFLANDLLVDILCRAGIVRIIDAGGSYQKLCRTLGGNELRFDINKPFSLNPFWGMGSDKKFEDDEGGSELAEMMPLLKDVTCQMAFPVQEPSNYEYQLVERAIEAGFRVAGDSMSTSDVYDWLEEAGKEDDVARRIALQLHPYAYGRLAVWFNGEPQMDLSNPFTILELEELNNDKELRAVILTMIMALTTRDMYLQSRDIPKILMIDEAWDLLGSASSGKFIETAFRRIRKYFGAAGIITQGFQDMDKSPAAQAAFDSCAWKFVLKQSGPSLEYAIRENKLGRSDDSFKRLLSSVRPGNGYSEVYVMGENGGGLFRFITDPYSYFLYTTNAKDGALIESKMRELNTDVEGAISALAEQQMS